MSNKIMEIKKILYNYFVESNNESTFYELTKNLSNSSRVTFETNEATLRRSLRIDEGGKLNLEAMLSLCQYYQIDVNSILGINLPSKATQNVDNAIIDESVVSLKTKIIYIYFKLGSELCSGQLRILSNNKATLTVRHFAKTKISYINSVEYYVGTIHNFNELNLSTLELNFSRKTNESDIFTYFDCEKLFITISDNELKENACSKGFLAAMTVDASSYYPIVVSDKELDDSYFKLIENSLTINPDLTFVIGKDVSEAIKDFIKNESEYSPLHNGNEIKYSLDGIIDTTLQYFVFTKQMSISRYKPLELNEKKIYFIDKTEYCSFMDYYHNCLGLDFEILFYDFQKISFRLESVKYDFNELIK